MFIKRNHRSKSVKLKGVMVCLLVGLMVFSLFTSLIISPVLAGEPAGPDGSWTECATEGAICSFSGTKEVRFWAAGQPSKFKSIVSMNGTGCTMAAFGNDPAVGTAKSCYYRDVQFDSGVTAVISGLNNKVTFTFFTYAMQAGTLDELKSKITVKKTGASAYTALGAEDIVANPTSTAASSTLEINFKDPLVGSENSIQIAPEAFKDSNGSLIAISVTSLLVAGGSPDASYGWTNCAADGEVCGFYGRKEVRYWGTGTPAPNYGYLAKIITGSGGNLCTLFTFGNTDPAPGATKRCYYRDVQLDTQMTTAVSGLNNKVTVTFNTYAIQAGTLAELKSKITVKKTGDSAYTALGAEDTVANPTATATSSTLEIKFKDTLVGSGNSILIAPGAFKDNNGQALYIPVSSSLTLLGLGPDGSIGWTDCAAEGGKCSFSGRKEVRFWGTGAPAVPANYGFISKISTGVTNCPFDSFDPAYGTVKRCYYRDVQLDSALTTVISGTNNKVTVTFNTYAIQAGTLAELKSRVTIKKTGDSAYTALGSEDSVANPTSTATSSTLEINLKYPLVGSENSIQIAPEAFKDSDGSLIDLPIKSSLTLLGNGPDGSIGWTYCAPLGANCEFLGTKEVRLWGTGSPALPPNYGFLSRIVSKVTCSILVFGSDPAPDANKSCYYRDVQPYSLTNSVVGGLNNKVTFTFNTYAIQAGTLAELKSKIEVKKTGASAYTALGAEDTVENPTSGTLVINFKDALVGSENAILIAPGAFKDSDGKPINTSIASPSLMLVPTAPDGSYGWTECAPDNGKCNFSGTKEVRFWGTGAPAVPANYGFISKVFTNGAACNGTIFGNDPAPGTTKKCYSRDVQLDSAMTAAVSGPNNKVTFTFKAYAIQAGTLAELKSKITVKKTGASAYTALDPEDTVAATTTPTNQSSTFEINFKDSLVGSGNSIQIAPGAYKDLSGQLINTLVSFPLLLLPTAPDGNLGWTYCAAENEYCLFTGVKEVRYWGTGAPAVPANYGFSSNISISNTECITRAFGNIDPAPGTVKRCFYRDVQSDSVLSDLSVDQGTLVFSPTQLNYLVEVPNSVTSLHFNATKAVSSQTLTVTGAVQTSATGNVYAYAISNLSVGYNNPIEIKVIRQDGTFFTYKLTVYRHNLIATEVPIPVASAPVTISVPYGVNASIQAPAPTPVSGVPNTVQTTLPQVEVTASTSWGNVLVTIPSGTTVTAPVGWNGIINLPRQADIHATTNGTILQVIELGSATQSLTFSKAVRIVMPFQAGYNVSFVRSGETLVIPITTVLTADSQAAGDALPAGGDSKINVESDLVIWTKHFTQFATFLPGTTPNAATPSIGMQPLGATVNEGDSGIALNVAATVSDGGTLSYQWYSNTISSNSGGTAISGATSASYAAPTTTLGTTYYYVVVTNTNNSTTNSQTATVTSSAVAVAVNALMNAAMPSISVQPTGATVNEGASSPSLSVAATVSDGGMLSYQWYSNTISSNSGGTVISGATSASYAVPTTTAGTTYYYVVVTNTNSSATGSQTATTTSGIAKLTVNAANSSAPSAPTGLTAIAGNGQVALTWNSVSETVTYSVYEGTSSGSYGLTPIAAVSGAAYSYTATGLTNGATYYFAVKASNAGGNSDYSNEVGATPIAATPSASNNANLSSMAVSGRTLSPSFDPSTFSYTVSVANGVTLVTVTPTTSDSNARVKVNGMAVTSGQSSGAISLNVGNNPLTVAVTAEDGMNMRTYTVNVARAEAITASSSAPIHVTTEPVSITIPASVTNAEIVVTTTTAGSSKEVTLPLVEVQADTTLGIVSVTIPDGTKITAPANWDGTIKLPQVLSNSSVAINSSIVSSVVEVGSTDVSLTFDRAVRLLIPNQGGKKAGFVRNGIFTEITGTVTADTQAAADNEIAAGGDAKITIGSDLVIWTKHFTQFVSFTQVDSTSNTVTSGGGGAAATSTANTATKTATIAAASGGTITLSGATIEVPAGAMDSNFQVTVDIVSNTSILPIDSALQLVSEVYEIKKDKDGEFSKPVFITLPFDKTKVDFAKLTAGVYWLNEQTHKWVSLDSLKVDEGNGTASGSVNHFTKFAVLALDKAKTEQPQTNEADFADIKGRWYEANVRELVKLGAINGYPDNTFKPDANITRAEFVTVIVKAFQLGEQAGKTFADTETHWAKRAIETAAAAGIVAGYSDSSFRPDDFITREQMAAIVVRAAKLAATDKSVNFQDSSDISDWARTALATATAQGMINGYEDGTVKPKANTTRAEAATVILRALQAKK